MILVGNSIKKLKTNFIIKFCISMFKVMNPIANPRHCLICNPYLKMFV